MNIVTVLDNIIYFIGQRSEVYELVELDMNTNEQTVIYQSKTQEAINNAQFYKKYKNMVHQHEPYFYIRIVSCNGYWLSKYCVSELIICISFMK